MSNNISIPISSYCLVAACCDGLSEIADKIHERGKLEGKLEDAKKMKDKGYSIEDIAEITGLPIEEIEKL